MRTQAFDQWTRSFVSNQSRRALFQIATSATLAGVTTAAATGDAGAACVKLGKPCDRNADHCCHGGVCRHRKCRCRNGEVRCHGKCVKGTCCRNADCTERPDGLCGEDHRCHYPPTCLNQGPSCWFDFECCSGDCVDQSCALSAIGEPCRYYSDCQGFASICHNYICRLNPDF